MARCLKVFSNIPKGAHADRGAAQRIFSIVFETSFPIFEIDGTCGFRCISFPSNRTQDVRKCIRWCDILFCFLLVIRGIGSVGSTCLSSSLICMATGRSLFCVNRHRTQVFFCSVVSFTAQDALTTVRSVRIGAAGQLVRYDE